MSFLRPPPPADAGRMDAMVIPLRGAKELRRLSKEMLVAAEAAYYSSLQASDWPARDYLRAEADRLAELSVTHSDTARQLEAVANWRPPPPAGRP